MARRNDAPKYPIDAISMLQSDHRKITDLFAKYQSATNFTARQQVADQVFMELDLHAQLEEHVFYPAFEEQTGKKGMQLVADSRKDHAHVKELMTELQGLDVEDEVFEAKFDALMANVQRHMAAEEQQLFPEAKEILADQLDDLMYEMVGRKNQFTILPGK
jgi:hemerythrin superfamily protein